MVFVDIKHHVYFTTLQIWAPWGTAMLFHSVLMKSVKGLDCEVFDTSAAYSSLAHDVTGADFWA